MTRYVHSLWFWFLVAGALLAVGALVMPVFAADLTGDNVIAQWLTINGSGDATRPGASTGGPWGTMQIMNTSGLNAYYASSNDATHCTWEFHPGNYVDNGWSFGALSKTAGSDLEITRKVGGAWQPTDLLVDFDTGNVGIGTTTPTRKLQVENTSGEAVYGKNTTSGNYGLIGNDIYGVFGSSISGDGVHGTSSTGNGVKGESNSGVGVVGYNQNSNNYGYLGGLSWGAYGKNMSSGAGVYGEAVGSSDSPGVYGENTYSNNYGYLGGSDFGVYGYNFYGNYGRLGETTRGVYGYCTSGSGSQGVWGTCGSVTYGYLGDQDYGVYGKHNTSGNQGYLGSSDYGAYGKYESSDNWGYLGGNSYGVYGKGGTGANIGVYGINQNGTYGYLGSDTCGAYGYKSGSGNSGSLGGSEYGVYGHSQSGYAVQGVSSSGYAGYFDGDVTVTGDLDVTGTLTKGTDNFKIDHPLDPENKYLSHSVVESPDIKNIYDGNVVLDEQGEAVVELPSYFEALNRDFRYQLTCIGGYAPVYIAEKVSNNRFKIAGGNPAMEVSWQVTGIRQDPYANAHPIVVEEEKPANEKGYYLHPKEWGQPEEKGIESLHSVR
jgi:hypothetical protein